MLTGRARMQIACESAARLGNASSGIRAVLSKASKWRLSFPNELANCLMHCQFIQHPKSKDLACKAHFAKLGRKLVGSFEVNLVGQSSFPCSRCCGRMKGPRNRIFAKSRPIRANCMVRFSSLLPIISPWNGPPGFLFHSSTPGYWSRV